MSKFLKSIMDNDDDVFFDLLPKVNPKDKNSRALQYAVSYNRPDFLCALIPVSNPKDQKSRALCLAARQNKWELVRLLTPVSNPKSNQSLALQSAIVAGNQEMVDFLHPLSNAKIALRETKIVGDNPYNELAYECFHALNNRVKAQEERGHIKSQINMKQKPAARGRKI